MTVRSALVLGGGGVAGIAWETGVLVGLADAGADVLGADLIVGTSAGSAVTAQVSSGLPLEELFRRQTDPALQAREIPAELDLPAYATTIAKVMAGAEDALEMRRRIGAWAREARTVPEKERREAIASRLPSFGWPERPIAIVAVDAETGERRIFDPASGVDLVDAVAASCAVPGIWPPASIDGRPYVDGGAYSNENADLALGYDRVLILSPIPADAPVPPWGGPLDEIVEQLRRRGSTVTVIHPDEASLAAMGPNPLDPSVREAAAHAGRAQGRREADAVRHLIPGASKP
ncbi:patatin-like phospholipase family protein [Actinoallomurus rhizosphaericola]|uniref:patatin-like phospholipase family protein n=1 Tax=Actinoallomurus rhizosphaericola TaxID=2952536 RepID=UPI002090F363|nr:patatin-like phospholipase family protein [Actinoallomurus rhizosphaericola]MCO5993252.1 patatin-like phospholipase family protein [Actinoallomurus rhizosphaericola]